MASPAVKRESSVVHRSDILDGRPGFRIQTQWGHVSVLEGGGHICELISRKHGEVNPLWKPTWKTVDPSTYSQRKHSRVYGPPPEGRLLAGIAGHSINFDSSAPRLQKKLQQVTDTHGEAPVVDSRRQQRSGKSASKLVYDAQLPQAQMRLQRTISLDHLQPVVYCEETAVNLATFDRPISWNHHVTFGPPFLESAVTLFDMPATRSKNCPATFSRQMSIEPDAEFRWPNAPMKKGGVLNLRTSRNGSIRSLHPAHLFDPAAEPAFIAVCNPRLRLLVLYLFNRTDFPWVGNWEESYSRAHAPWKGREFCRGFEFSTTPFPIPRRETVAQGELFDEATYIWLPAKSIATRRYMIVLQDVPETFKAWPPLTLSAVT